MSIISCNMNNKQQVDASDNNLTDTVKVAEESKENSSKDAKPTSEDLAPYFVKEGSWVQVKNALSADQTGIYLYFQTEHDVARNIRLRIQYGNSSTFRIDVNGKSYTYKSNRSQGSKNIFVEGEVTWYDGSLKKEDLKFLETLVKSKNATITLSNGSTIIIDSETKTNLQRTLNYFESLDGLLPKSNMVNIRRL